MELKHALKVAEKRWLHEKKAHRGEYVGAWAKCNGECCGQLFNTWNPYRDDRDGLCVDCRMFDLLELKYNDE